MRKVKLFLILISLFSLGFVTHALLFPNTPFEITALSQQSILGKQDPNDDFITHVDYAGDQFKPRSVTVKKGNYIAITNKSREKLMWLVSNNPDLSTPRAYGQGERLQLVLLRGGEYKVANKLNPKAWVSVTVKE